MADAPLAFPVRRREWPLDLLDVDQIRVDGWRPVPFREYVLKVHNHCNLRCAYCYVYEMGDQTWRTRPTAMSESTIAMTITRIAEHVSDHSLKRIKLIFHGGEPLLAGEDLIAETAELLRNALPQRTRVDLGIHTNGVLLNDTVLRTLLAHRIHVGVSVDGSGADHDRHRRQIDGRGSHAAVSAALTRLARAPYRDIFAGLLCTIDPRNDPLRTFEALLESAPPTIDFLLPHGNWTAPPKGRGEATPDTPYADWLIAIFDRWYSAPRRETRIRTFEQIIRLVLGGQSRSETVGLTPVSLLVIESDGTIEQVDALKSAYHGAASTGLNVHSDAFDTALDHPGIVARQIGTEALSDTCRRCRIHEICGGGFYPHRYRAGEGYRNPSVYCPDLFRLIQHIRRRVNRDIDTL